MPYAVARPNEYLVVTGMFIKDIKVMKKGYVFPFQSVKRFLIQPIHYHLNLNAMSIEKLEFNLPVVFTIGPHDEPQALYAYAKFLADSNNDDRVRELVRGVLEGEVRVIAASMTIEEIFREKRLFKENVLKHVATELDHFGLFVYNANIQQLSDTPDSQYFKYLRLKSQEGAINQAKVDVAEARMKGNLGEKDREGKTRMEVSKIEASAKISENENDALIMESRARLTAAKTELENQTKLAVIQCQKKCELLENQLQQQAEAKRAIVVQERLRAETLSKTKVAAERTKTKADASFYVQKMRADADLYKAVNNASGVVTLLEAKSSGIEQIARGFQGDGKAALQFVMMDRGVYVDLAKANAEAIRGLEPNITVWNTGSSQKETNKRAEGDAALTSGHPTLGHAALASHKKSAMASLLSVAPLIVAGATTAATAAGK
eukprot:jgi/Hompol1/6214/HPOL_002213-RA